MPGFLRVKLLEYLASDEDQMIYTAPHDTFVDVKIKEAQTTGREWCNYPPNYSLESLNIRRQYF